MMSKLFAAFLCLWMFTASGAVMAQEQAAKPAPQPAAAVASPQAQAAEQLEVARKNLARLADQIKNAADDDSRLAELKVEVDAATKQIIAISVATRPRLDEIKARLAELGDPPAEGAPPETDVVTQERKRLLAERGEINALTGTAEDLSVQATKLSNGITATRRALFSNTLLKHTDINGPMVMDAIASLSLERQAFTRTVGSWLTFAWNFKRLQLLSALFLSLCAALVLLAGMRKLFFPLIHRELLSEEPGYITRLSVAFWSTMIPTLAMGAFAATSYFFLQVFKVLRPDIAPIISAILAISVVLVFVSTLSNAVLAPKQNTWRLVRVSDHGARLLVLSIFAMALVNVLDYVAGTISEVMGSPVVFTVVKSLIATIIIGLILMAMSLIKPIVPAGETLDGQGRPWPRAVKLLFVLTGIALILATLAGYVGLARFIATQIVITGAILVTMYIGILTGKAVAKQNALADTVVGRYLEKRFGLEQVALDQTGLAAGLGIYMLVVLFFIPLIMLQWGFQIADIEAWAYRIFTDINIGSIKISIVGILAGILLFAGGYVVTRWFQRWLDGNVMARSRVDTGVRNSVKTGIGYLGIGLAGLIGVSAAGFDLSNLALVAGALSLGVGFGLQNIVSNFVSGLILLVERPFKVGDWVVTGTTEGFVKRISVRATEIETFQRQTIMVPNSLFINASVGNWTHKNKLGRSDIPVTVSYNSAPRQVMDTLLQIAGDHQLVLKNPAPQAVFAAFGDSTMTFELRVYLADIVNGNGVRNDLRLAIYERFKEEGLGAPFPKEELEPESLPPGPESDAAALQAENAGPATITPLPVEAFKRSGTQRRPRRVTIDGAAEKD
ncbi:mechanosensitive ion channel family protein [Rhizobium sp. LjRoot98]|uniref:mechanosensitive ion channel family protein n=2 Tax=Rhizobium TaxID=379 RepID=UPI000715BA9B|nr:MULTISPECIES: mechanosensitive ion channel family protein [unclassified Rhizobium]KQV29469.1 mechanosensitive ion channel protein [Rhizobium sp. Root1204]KQY05392.1 mechanosensitive ion channel protein [Rhizobium sp. Root1334]KRC02004.1 mechanosensitive ion channel protein [Rhizobium sp. Root73]